MKEKIANTCEINRSQVGITATTGEDLTSFGKGEGLQCICIITTMETC